eukprot:4609477-Prymnesium_polylepis.1
MRGACHDSCYVVDRAHLDRWSGEVQWCCTSVSCTLRAPTSQFRVDSFVFERCCHVQRHSPFAEERHADAN